MSCVGDLKGRLVSGTFRVMSGSDFKGRRSKAQMVVEQGPQKTGFANYEKHGGQYVDIDLCMSCMDMV